MSFLVKNNKIFLIFTLFYLYITIALFESTKGNFIPFFMEEFNISNSTISLILSINTVGAIIGSFVAGQLCETRGHKFVYIVGSVISTIAVLIAPFTRSVFTLALFNFMFGLGRSCIAIGVDSMVPALSVGFESILMNITHFMYGMGSFAGQSAVGVLLSRSIGWRSIYLYLLIFFVIATIISLIVKMPNVQIKSEKTYKKEDFYKNPYVYMLIIALTFGLISESVVLTWFISYMRGTYGLDPAGAAKYASVYFLLFALGRLLGGFVLNKTGNIKGLAASLAISAVFIITGLQTRSNGLILIAISGLFMSITFPTMMVIISSVFNQNSSYAIGFIVTISNILNVIMFNVIGALNDILGTYRAFYTAPIALVCFVIMLVLIMIKRKKENINQI